MSQRRPLPDSEPRRAAADLPVGRDMLCFSHDWNGDPLSKTHLMRLLARDNRILWVNSIGYRAPTASARDLRRAISKLASAASPLREVEPNIHVLSPLVIPAHASPRIRAFNRWFLRRQVLGAMRRLGFQRPINWVFNPAAAMIAGTLAEDLLIYYCVDEYTAFSGVPREALTALEADLLDRADVIIASSEELCRSKLGRSGLPALVRHGVEWDHFRAALDPSTKVPEEIAHLPRPVLGYFGLIGEDWVDIPLLEHVAKQLPHASIVMLGKVTMDVSSLTRLPNVHLLGRKPYQSLPAYCKGFDAALIPFPISDVTRSANPLKAREYLAAGLPVISTAIPEVEVLGACRIGRDRDDFVQQIHAALASPGPSAGISDSIRHESWEARLREAWSHVAAVAQRRAEHVNATPPAPPRDPLVASVLCRPALPGLLTTILQDIRCKARWCYGNDHPRSVLKACFTDGTAAMVLYRLMQRCRRWRLSPLEMLFNKLNAVCCNCIIGRGAEFGPELVLIHSTGVVINGAVRAGRALHLEHQVTLGAERGQSPTLADNVFIGAGAKVIGPVTLGHGVRVGANAVVVDNVPAHHTAVGVPARIIAPTNSSPAPHLSIAA